MVTWELFTILILGLLTGVVPSSLRDDEGILRFTDLDKAVLLNLHFVNVGRVNNTLLSQIITSLKSFDSISDVDFNENVIFCNLKNLKIGSSPF